MKIRKLSDIVINKIAAGEIIERPQSVIRELVDNSVDAGAALVSIYIENGGVGLIRVVDDGNGIPADEAQIAFERHATSKIASDVDLFAISSMGFRGEALASIAAVSRVRLTTATQHGHGVEVVIEGGELLQERQVPSARGADFTIADLFYNQPARKKFLGTSKGEERKILGWLKSYALAHPEVGFKLYVDGVLKLDFAPKTFLERATELFPKDMLSVSNDEIKDISVVGLIGQPSNVQSTAGGLTIIVNKRVVQDRAVARAVKDGYDSMLKGFEYPVGVIAITISPESLDVNVHPQKSEVRFQDSRAVYIAVRAAVLGAVRGIRPELLPTAVVSSTDMATPPPIVVMQDDVVPDHRFESIVDSRHRFNGQYLGQALGCYLLFQEDNKLLVVDMHAAHERINFNRIRSEMIARGELQPQPLLVPLSIKLPKDECETLAGRKDELLKLGLDIDLFGHDAVIVRAIPAFLDLDKIESLFMEIINDELGLGEAAFAAKLDAVAARLACHGSVRSGDAITSMEATALIDSLLEAEGGAACPHGRPAIKRFELNDIERWFGRDR